VWSLTIDVTGIAICVHSLQEDVNAEELKTEIAGLEGLMKDLSAITQRQLDT